VTVTALFDAKRPDPRAINRTRRHILLIHARKFTRKKERLQAVMTHSPDVAAEQ